MCLIVSEAGGAAPGEGVVFLTRDGGSGAAHSHDRTGSVGADCRRRAYSAPDSAGLDGFACHGSSVTFWTLDCRPRTRRSEVQSVPASTCVTYSARVAGLWVCSAGC